MPRSSGRPSPALLLAPLLLGPALLRLRLDLLQEGDVFGVALRYMWIDGAPDLLASRANRRGKFFRLKMTMAGDPAGPPWSAM